MPEESPVFMHDHLPRLMLPSVAFRRPYYGDFYNILNEEILHHELTELHNKRCVGSSRGWLIMVDDDSPSIFAVNPLIRNSTRIHLPSLMSFPDILDFNGDEYIYWMPALGSIPMSSQDINYTYLKKVFLSKDPTEEGCMVVAIFGELKRLAFCRIGDEEWNIIAQQDFINGYEDVVFDQEGRFYAVNYQGIVVTGNLQSPFWELVYEPPATDYADRKYLVFDTKGQLMLVNRYIAWKDHNDSDDEDGESGCDHEEINESSNDFPHKTSKFRIFRLDKETGKLEEVDSLEDGVLFLGDNQSLCLSSMEFPGYEADCVYFTDDSLFAHIEPRIGAHDIGVFNMKDGCIEKIQCVQIEDGGIWPPPIWVALPSAAIKNI